MRYVNVDLDVEKDRYEAIRKQLDEQKQLLSLPSGITVRDYLLQHIIPLGMEEAEKRMNKARAPHIVSPYE